MGHRDRTFVSYAAEDASAWWEMRAWPEEQRIPFDFEDAYDLHAKGDTNRDVIRRRLRERMGRSRQAIVLVGQRSRAVADNQRNYFFYELDVLTKLGMPIVVVNLNGVRRVDRAHLPQPLAGRYTINVSFEPKTSGTRSTRSSPGTRPRRPRRPARTSTRRTSTPSSGI